jgi:Transposase DDE domain
MEEQIILIYCLCDDYIRSKEWTDWCNVKWSTAEVMTAWVVGMKFFYGNVNRARTYLIENKMIKKIFTLSALMKRVHRIPMEWWTDILEFILKWGKSIGMPKEFIVDAFPVSVCRNIRIQRCRIYQGEEFRGYNASKHEYFYGIKATVLTTIGGCPVRVLLCPGREHDSTPFKLMDLNLPEESEIYGDNAYYDEVHEYQRFKNEKIRIIAARKSNSRDATVVIRPKMCSGGRGAAANSRGDQEVCLFGALQ